MRIDTEEYGQYLEKKYLPGRSFYLNYFIYPKYLKEFKNRLEMAIYDFGCGNVSEKKRKIAMKTLIGFKNVVILTVILFFCSIRKAHAYIDLGTGSYIIQVMIGSLLGAVFALKVYWKKIKTYFSNLFSKRTKTDKYEN